MEKTLNTSMVMEQKMISLLVATHTVLETRISVEDIVMEKNILYINKSKEFDIATDNPWFPVTWDTPIDDIITFLHDNGKVIYKNNDSFRHWTTMLLGGVKRRLLHTQNNKPIGPIEIKNRLLRINKLEKISDMLSAALTEYENNSKLDKLVGMMVVKKNEPDIGVYGKLIKSDSNGLYYIYSGTPIHQVTSIFELEIFNDMSLRHYYSQAKTIEEKLLAIVIDSSKLINQKISALGVNVVNGKRISVRTLKGKNITTNMNITEYTTIQQLYKFVSDAMLYQNISPAFITNCESNVYKSFDDYNLEYNLVRKWFEEFNKEYEVYEMDKDIIDIKNFIYVVLKDRLDHFNKEKDPIIKSDIIDNHINKLEKAIALTLKELDQ